MHEITCGACAQNVGYCGSKITMPVYCYACYHGITNEPDEEEADDE